MGEWMWVSVGGFVCVGGCVCVGVRAIESEEKNNKRGKERMAERLRVKEKKSHHVKKCLRASYCQLIAKFHSLFLFF